MGGSQNFGYLFEGLNNKDYSNLGSILGSLYFGKLPYVKLLENICFLWVPIHTDARICLYYLGCSKRGSTF